jgi:hypothetical protein
MMRPSNILKQRHGYQQDQPYLGTITRSRDFCCMHTIGLDQKATTMKLKMLKARTNLEDGRYL